MRPMQQNEVARITLAAVLAALLSGTGVLVTFAKDTVTKGELADAVETTGPWVRDRGAVLQQQAAQQASDLATAQAMREMLNDQKIMLVELRVMAQKVEDISRRVGK